LVINPGEHTTDRWEALSAEQPDLEIEYVSTAGAALRALADLQEETALVAQAAVLPDHDVAGEVRRATEDPALENVRWGLLASDGVDLDGRWVDGGNYLDAPGTPRRGPLRALNRAEPGVALIAPEMVRDLAQIPGSVTELLRSGWKSGWGSFASPFLRFSYPGNREAFRAARSLPASNEASPIDLAAAAAQLQSVRPDPTVTIAVRTTLDRPALLTRTIASIADRGAEADEVLLVGTVAAEALQGVSASARADHPDLDIRTVEVADSGVPSRTAGTTAALEQARSDYVWFLDDDDCAFPNSLERIRAAVHGSDRPVIVAASDAYEETWEGDGTEARLVADRHVRRYDPYEWFRAFTGWNLLPNCSVVVPRERALTRLQEVPLRHDLGEDYALQLLLYTSLGVTVTVVDGVIARVSVRPTGDNVVTMTDRGPWLRSVGSFFADLSADELSAATALWATGEELRALPYRIDRQPEAGVGPDPTPASWQAAVKQRVPAQIRPALARLRATLRNRTNR
jgi:hypothetical protein